MLKVKAILHNVSRIVICLRLQANLFKANNTHRLINYQEAPALNLNLTHTYRLLWIETIIVKNESHTQLNQINVHGIT